MTEYQKCQIEFWAAACERALAAGVLSNAEWYSAQAFLVVQA